MTFGEIGPPDVHPPEDFSYLLLLPAVGIRTRCTVVFMYRADRCIGLGRV